MENRDQYWRGCLLGLAVGDAMGYAVDRLSWEEISRDYGPDGIRGYDLVNGYADISSHTQIAAYTACGLLMGMTRGQRLKKAVPYARYAELAMRDWCQGQHARRRPERSICWVSDVDDFLRRRCLDTRMLDTLNRQGTGSSGSTTNSFDSPGCLGAAVSAGAFFAPERMPAYEVGNLGASVVALTHGDPMTILSGAVTAYIVAGILQDPETSMREHFLQATEVVAEQFGGQFPQVQTLKRLLHRATLLASNTLLPPRDALEHLGCTNFAECLAGAMYVCLTAETDFDGAMVLAVNQSGRSAAVGALAGAFLGARLGSDAIPNFYLEGLESVLVLAELAEDLMEGCPMGCAEGFFDDTWDQKYIQGRRVDPEGWAEE